MADKIKITAEQRSQPNLRKLARALISLAGRKRAEHSPLPGPEGGPAVQPPESEVA